MRRTHLVLVTIALASMSSAAVAKPATPVGTSLTSKIVRATQRVTDPIVAPVVMNGFVKKYGNTPTEHGLQMSTMGKEYDWQMKRVNKCRAAAAVSVATTGLSAAGFAYGLSRGDSAGTTVAAGSFLGAQGSLAVAITAIDASRHWNRVAKRSAIDDAVGGKALSWDQVPPVLKRAYFPERQQPAK